jgi:hypothetical protein
MKYRVKPEFVGLEITRRLGAGNTTITLDTRESHSSEQLGNYYRHSAFREFIEEYEDTVPRPYQGVEHPVWNPELSATETLCTLCGHGECECSEPAKPTKPRKRNAKK